MGQKVNPISNRLGISEVGIPTGTVERITATLCWKIAKFANI